MSELANKLNGNISFEAYPLLGGGRGRKKIKSKSINQTIWRM